MSVRPVVLYNPSYFQAAKDGNMEKIDNICRNYGWTDAPDHKGNCMLYYAVKKSHWKAVNLLIKWNVELYQNLKGRSALDLQMPSEIRRVLEEKKMSTIRAIIERRLYFSLESQYTLYWKSLEEQHGSLELQRHCIEACRALFCEQLRLLSLLPCTLDVVPNAFVNNMASTICIGVLHGHEHFSMILNSIKSKEWLRDRVARLFVFHLLRYGKVQEAQEIIDKLVEGDVKKLLGSQVLYFSKLFKEIEKLLLENGLFAELIENGFALNWKHKEISDQSADQIKQLLLKSGSFTKGIEVSKEFEDSALKIFTLDVIASSGVADIAYFAHCFAVVVTSFDEEIKGLPDSVYNFFKQSAEISIHKNLPFQFVQFLLTRNIEVWIHFFEDLQKTSLRAPIAKESFDLSKKQNNGTLTK